MKIDQLSSWEAFLAVAKHGNFSKAAKALNSPLPQISKRVSKLEADLGVRLFQRTTRSVSLTDEAQSLLPKVAAIMEDLLEAENLFEKDNAVKGTLKLTCVPFIAHRLLLPLLDKFMSEHPGIHIQLELSENFVNIIEEGFDLAIRIETPKDSQLIYRQLVPNDLVFCASPDYLKKNKIKKVEDLKQHKLLMLSIHRRCQFKQQALKLSDLNLPKKITCENGAFLTEMALQGMGILLRSIWDVQEYLRTGQLVQVLKNHPLETFGHVYAVVPSRRYLAPRVRLFLDFLLEESRHWRPLK